MTEAGTAPRYDMYRLIHKGLRVWMADTLGALGRLDAADGAAVAAVLAEVRGLLAFCEKHVAHEDTHVHAAMEARVPGSAGDVAADHGHHTRDLRALEEAAAAVEAAHGHDAVSGATHVLYRRLALFVGENLVHMEREESHNNAVLWQAYADEELRAIEGAIVAAQSPEDQTLTMRRIVAAATPAERAAFLSDVRAAVPPGVFPSILQAVQAPLAAADRDRLARDLAVPSLAA